MSTRSLRKRNKEQVAETVDDGPPAEKKLSGSETPGSDPDPKLNVRMYGGNEYASANLKNISDADIQCKVSRKETECRKVEVITTLPPPPSQRAKLRVPNPAGRVITPPREKVVYSEMEEMHTISPGETLSLYLTHHKRIGIFCGSRVGPLYQHHTIQFGYRTAGNDEAWNHVSAKYRVRYI